MWVTEVTEDTVTAACQPGLRELRGNVKAQASYVAGSPVYLPLPPGPPSGWNGAQVNF